MRQKPQDSTFCNVFFIELIEDLNYFSLSMEISSVKPSHHKFSTQNLIQIVLFNKLFILQTFPNNFEVINSLVNLPNNQNSHDNRSKPIKTNFDPFKKPKNFSLLMQLKLLYSEMEEISRKTSKNRKFY